MNWRRLLGQFRRLAWPERALTPRESKGRSLLHSRSSGSVDHVPIVKRHFGWRAALSNRNGWAVCSYRSWNASSRCSSSRSDGKSFGVTTLRWTIEKKISIWLSQLAWLGVCTRVTAGHRFPESGGGLFSPVRRAVVRDPKEPARGSIGLDGHDLLDQSVDGANGGLGLASPKQLGAMHVPRGQIGQGPRPVRKLGRDRISGDTALSKPW